MIDSANSGKKKDLSGNDLIAIDPVAHVIPYIYTYSYSDGSAGCALYPFIPNIVAYGTVFSKNCVLRNPCL